MVNSSWTKNHVDAIFSFSDSDMSTLHFFLPHLSSFKPSRRDTPDYEGPEPTFKEAGNGERSFAYHATPAMTTFSLNGRERVILGIAQFR
jgi:alpha-1,2-mannosyltransferase